MADYHEHKKDETVLQNNSIQRVYFENELSTTSFNNRLSNAVYYLPLRFVVLKILGGVNQPFRERSCSARTIGRARYDGKVDYLSMSMLWSFKLLNSYQKDAM